MCLPIILLIPFAVFLKIQEWLSVTIWTQEELTPLMTWVLVIGFVAGVLSWLIPGFRKWILDGLTS